MNSGVLLMRNSDWNREIIARMATYGTHPMDIASEEVGPAAAAGLSSAAAAPACSLHCTAPALAPAHACHAWQAVHVYNNEPGRAWGIDGCAISLRST